MNPLNLPGSGTASSYLEALEHLASMIAYEPLGVEDCQDIFPVHGSPAVLKIRQTHSNPLPSIYRKNRQPLAFRTRLNRLHRDG